MRGLRGGGGCSASPWGGGGLFRLRAEGVGGSSCSSTSMTSATPILRCLTTWTRMASHATSTHSGLRLSHPVSTFSPKTTAVVTVLSSPIRDTPVCTRLCPLTTL